VHKVKKMAAARENFVKLVLEHKNLLFGRLSPTVTNEAKLKEWENIRNSLVAGGFAHYAGKKAEDMRGAFSDMKRRTLDKKQKSETTGAGRVFFTKVCFPK
jgi:hypothetical protein